MALVRAPPSHSHPGVSLATLQLRLLSAHARMLLRLITVFGSVPNRYRRLKGILNNRQARAAKIDNKWIGYFARNASVSPSSTFLGMHPELSTNMV
ncbi:hypothetical protein KM043_015281 [Ampulex compressa]|nr:hypothetical protein KM043_015281 [Ampulex compressa]